MSQTASLDRVVQRFSVSITSHNPVSPPAALSREREEEESCCTIDRELVGGLMWIADDTRPDTLNAVRKVAGNVYDPSLRHWRATLKIVENVKGTRQKGITYNKSPSTQLVIFGNSAFPENKQAR